MCIAGMGETCSHVVAAIYRVESAVRIGLTNPAYTSNANEWVPDRKTNELKKIKDLDFSREDFCQRGKKRASVASQTKMFDPLKNCDLKPLSMKGFAETINKVSLSITYCGNRAKGGFCQRTNFNKNCLT